ncbi:recombination regulator RecX [Alteribacillus sp. YIM 98480]|uniref:recombination regulator RecX n=1 Tax=Alteribacillus sp. YIM 98480 TaxID=2606599 RepID=UPI00131C3D3B|nr:recombination regulator RecX [Alteribacillus sp. YIM 98480]
MKISKITTQKNRKDRFNIFTDENGYEEYAFSVDENVLVKFQLKKGSTITKAEKVEILQADQQRKAFNDAIYYLTHSMRTEYQIKQYLIKKEYNEGVIEEAIRKMKEYQYIDDKEFAMAFVRTKIKTTDKGPAIIKEELFQKGISSETAEKALLQFTLKAQLEAAQTFLQKKGKQKQNESASSMKKRLLDRLLQKGFSLEIALQAWENEHLEVSQEEELKALRLQGEKAKKKFKNKYSGKNLEMKIKEFLYRKGFPIPLIDNYLQGTELLEDEDDGKKI